MMKVVFQCFRWPLALISILRIFLYVLNFVSVLIVLLAVNSLFEVLKMGERLDASENSIFLTFFQSNEFNPIAL